MASQSYELFMNEKYFPIITDATDLHVHNNNKKKVNEVLLGRQFAEVSLFSQCNFKIIHTVVE